MLRNKLCGLRPDLGEVILRRKASDGAGHAATLARRAVLARGEIGRRKLGSL